MPDFSRQLVLTYSKVFGEEKELPDETLSSLDKPTWAKILARLNHLARTEKNYGIIDVLKDWFGEPTRDYSNELLHKIINAYQALNIAPGKITTINIWTNLTLLDKILQVHIDNGQHLNNVDSEKELFDIYIATNDLLGANGNRIPDSVSKELFPDPIDWFARTSLTLLLPYHDISHFSATELFVTGFIKGFYLFKFLENDHEELMELFLENYGVSTWKDYLKGILPLATHVARPETDFGLNYLTLKDVGDKAQRKIFLERLALTDDVDYEIKTDFLAARANPLFRIDDETYLVLHHRYHSRLCSGSTAAQPNF